METNKENQVNNIKAKPTVARYILVAVSTIFWIFLKEQK